MTGRLLVVSTAAQLWAWRTFKRLPLSEGDWRFWPAHENDGDAQLRDLCEIMRPRYIFLLGWPHKVSNRVYDRWETVNLHCTPLPYGRGGGPIENMLLRGHTSTTMTAHRVVEQFDAGPIYCTAGQVSLVGTKEEILERFAAPCASLIERIVREQMEPLPQSGEVVQFRRLPPRDFENFWASRDMTSGVAHQ